MPQFPNSTNVTLTAGGAHRSGGRYYSFEGRFEPLYVARRAADQAPAGAILVDIIQDTVRAYVRPKIAVFSNLVDSRSHGLDSYQSQAT